MKEAGSAESSSDPLDPRSRPFLGEGAEPPFGSAYARVGLLSVAWVNGTLLFVLRSLRLGPLVLKTRSNVSCKEDLHAGVASFVAAPDFAADGLGAILPLGSARMEGRRLPRQGSVQDSGGPRRLGPG